MKIFNKALVLLLMGPLVGFAQADRYEDTPEFLAPQPGLYKSSTPILTHYFKLIKSDGTSETLSKENSSVLVKPASTMKIFTGWWAFSEGVRTNSYLATMLKTSSNAMAQSTLNLLGSPRDMELYYAGLGLDVTEDSLQVADGSGLSYDNQSNCDVQIELLEMIYNSAGYEDFRELMAKPGEEGTLSNRLKNLAGKVFAKTGTLRATAALSGFVDAPQGTIVFCVMSDFIHTTLSQERARIDSLVTRSYNQAQ